jgi:hypothetical protein
MICREEWGDPGFGLGREFWVLRKTGSFWGVEGGALVLCTKDSGSPRTWEEGFSPYRTEI